MEKTGKQLWFYCSLLIAVMLNSGRLLALRENGIVAHYWRFNTAEFAYQLLAQLGFCYFLFLLNLGRGRLARYRDNNRYLRYLSLNFFIAFVGMVLIGGVQKRVFSFNPNQIRGAFWLGYLTRYALASLLIGIIIKIVLLLRQNKQQAIENEQLKNAYTTAELELLKEQLNPHFLFNSLSSLSGVVRENPALAQQYIKHLSSVFRYTLIKPVSNLVTIKEELTMVESFAQLLKMRFENAFELTIDVGDTFLQYKLPHLSLQPLLENAAKHNAATLKTPLQVTIKMCGDELSVSNNLNPVDSDGTGTGLANLNQRYKILMQRKIDIEQTTSHFTVKLPLKHE